MTESKTIDALLRSGGAALPAIGAPDRTTMSRAELLHLVERTGGALRALGIRQTDAVAMVMPNEPEMAAVFVAVASWAAAAPLNAAYRADEFDFYLGDLDAKALIIQSGPDSPARAGVTPTFRQIALPDEFLDAGALPTLHDRYGLSTTCVVAAVKSWL